jgi:hypothetical protein
MQSAALIWKRRIPLNTTHSGLNKFAGFQDENFQLVFPEIQRMVKRGRHRRKGVDWIRVMQIESG